jgi:hypothetical protein
MDLLGVKDLTFFITICAIFIVITRVVVLPLCPCLPLKATHVHS